MTTPPTEKICSICHLPYEGWGNNAAPYPGRCCDDCNGHVLLARIWMIKGWDKAREPKR
jgi:hypothetical protein